jgi:hypothetical protein
LNVPSERIEYAVEWTSPSGAVQYSWPEPTRELAERYLDSRRAGVTGRIVQRTITTTAWEAS